MEFYCLILLKLFSSEKSFLSRTAHHHIISSHKDYTFECYRVLLSMDYFAHLIRYSTDFFLPRTTQLRKECRPYCNSTVLRIVMISTYRMKSATSPCDSSPSTLFNIFHSSTLFIHSRHQHSSHNNTA